MADTLALTDEEKQYEDSLGTDITEVATLKPGRKTLADQFTEAGARAVGWLGEKTDEAIGAIPRVAESIRDYGKAEGSGTIEAVGQGVLDVVGAPEKVADAVIETKEDVDKALATTRRALFPIEDTGAGVESYRRELGALQQDPTYENSEDFESSYTRLLDLYNSKDWDETDYTLESTPREEFKKEAQRLREKHGKLIKPEHLYPLLPAFPESEVAKAPDEESKLSIVEDWRNKAKSSYKAELGSEGIAMEDIADSYIDQYADYGRMSVIGEDVGKLKSARNVLIEEALASSPLQYVDWAIPEGAKRYLRESFLPRNTAEAENPLGLSSIAGGVGSGIGMIAGGWLLKGISRVGKLAKAADYVPAYVFGTNAKMAFEEGYNKAWELTQNEATALTSGFSSLPWSAVDSIGDMTVLQGGLSSWSKYAPKKLKAKALANLAATPAGSIASSAAIEAGTEVVQTLGMGATTARVTGDEAAYATGTDVTLAGIAGGIVGAGASSIQEGVKKAPALWEGVALSRKKLAQANLKDLYAKEDELKAIIESAATPEEKASAKVDLDNIAKYRVAAEETLKSLGGAVEEEATTQEAPTEPPAQEAPTEEKPKKKTTKRKRPVTDAEKTEIVANELVQKSENVGRPLTEAEENSVVEEIAPVLEHAFVEEEVAETVQEEQATIEAPQEAFMVDSIKTAKELNNKVPAVIKDLVSKLSEPAMQKALNSSPENQTVFTALQELAGKKKLVLADKKNVASAITTANKILAEQIATKSQAPKEEIVSKKTLIPVSASPRPVTFEEAVQGAIPIEDRKPLPQRRAEQMSYFDVLATEQARLEEDLADVEEGLAILDQETVGEASLAKQKLTTVKADLTNKLDAVIKDMEALPESKKKFKSEPAKKEVEKKKAKVASKKQPTKEEALQEDLKKKEETRETAKERLARIKSKQAPAKAKNAKPTTRELLDAQNKLVEELMGMDDAEYELDNPGRDYNTDLREAISRQDMLERKLATAQTLNETVPVETRQARKEDKKELTEALDSGTLTEEERDMATAKTEAIDHMNNPPQSKQKPRKDNKPITTEEATKDFNDNKSDRLAQIEKLLGINRRALAKATTPEGKMSLELHISQLEAEKQQLMSTTPVAIKPKKTKAATKLGLPIVSASDKQFGNLGMTPYVVNQATEGLTPNSQAQVSLEPEMLSNIVNGDITRPNSPEMLAAYEALYANMPKKQAATASMPRGFGRPEITGVTVEEIKNGISAPEVLKTIYSFMEALGIRTYIYEGRINMDKGTAGHYEVDSGLVRLAMVNDVNTALHEVSHAMDRKLGLLQAISDMPDGPNKEAIRAELYQLGQDLYGDKEPAGGYLSEGLAEFIRMYLSNTSNMQGKVIQDHAPNMLAWWTNKFGTPTPISNTRAGQIGALSDIATKKTTKELVGLSKMMKALDIYYNQPTYQSQRLAIVEPPSSIYKMLANLLNGGNRNATSLPQKVNKFLTWMLDKWYDSGYVFYEIDNAIRKAKEARGEEVSDKISDSFYRTFNALRGLANQRASYMLEKGGVDFYNASHKDTPSFREALEMVSRIPGITDPVTGKELDGYGKQMMLLQWMFADRAQHLWSEGKNPGMPLEDAVQIKKDMLDHLGVHADTFAQAATKIYDFQQGVLSYAAQASPYLASIINKFQKTGESFYIPLEREFKDMGAHMRSGGTQGAGSPFKRLSQYGSNRRIKNPFESIVKNTYKIVNSAHAAYVKDMLGTISSNPGLGLGHIYTLVKPEVVVAYSADAATYIQSIERAIREADPELSKSLKERTSKDARIKKANALITKLADAYASEDEGAYDKEVNKKSFQKFISTIKAELEAEGADLEGLSPEEILESYVESSTSMADIFVNMFTKEIRPKNSEFTFIPVHVGGGKVQYAQVDRRVYDALYDEGPEINNAFIKNGLAMLEATTKLTKMGAVTMNMAFAWGSNIPMDAQTALVTNKLKTNREFATRFVPAWGRMLGETVRYEINENTPFDTGPTHLMDTIDRIGLNYSGMIGQDIDQVRKALKDMSRVGDKLFPDIPKGDSIPTILAKVVKAFKSDPKRIGKQLLLSAPSNAGKALDTYQKLLSITENLSRGAAINLQLQDWGKTAQDELTFEEVLQLSEYYKEVAGNYSRQGSYARIANRYIPFFSAAIAFETLMARTVVGAYKNPAKLAKLAGVLSSVMMANWWNNKDEWWWKNLTEDEKRANFYISRGKGSLFDYLTPDAYFQPEDNAIPVKMGVFLAEMNYMIGSIMDSVYTDGGIGTTEMLYNTFGPLAPASAPFVSNTPSLPPIAKWIAEVASNNTFFGDAPIVPQGLENRLNPQMEYTRGTTETAKKIGQMLNTSPMKIQHFVDTISGSMMSRFIGTGEELLGLVEKPASSLNILALTPLAKYGNVVRGSKNVNEFYKNAELYSQKQPGEPEADRKNPILNPIQFHRRQYVKNTADHLNALAVLAGVETSRPRLIELRKTAADIALEANELLNRTKEAIANNDYEAQEELKTIFMGDSAYRKTVSEFDIGDAELIQEEQKLARGIGWEDR